MTRRIFRTMSAVALTVLLAALSLILGTLYNYFTQVQLDQLQIQTALAAHAVANEGMDYFHKLDGTMECRITWIDVDGTVLYDNRSNSVDMENHLAREEVQEALRQMQGRSLRHSDTLMEQYLYAAEQLPDGTVLRLSTSQSSVLNLLLGLSGSLLLVLAVTAGLSLYLAGRLAGHIVQPLNTLDLDHPRANTGYEEIAPLLGRLESQQIQLKAQAEELRRRQKEFVTVTQSLGEGLVLLSAGGTVLSINPAAARLLEVTPNCLGADFSVVNRNPQLAALVEQALAGEKGEKTLAFASGSFLASASPVRAGGQLSGVVVLLFDVTQKQQAELLRREFAANVSHEMKTPLHTISGYAELIKCGLVPEGDMAVFAEKIYAEAQKMTQLVEDTLRLSRLDEGGTDMRKSQLDLYEAAQGALEELQTAAELAEVTLELRGASVQMEGILPLVTAIAFNLVDNAIKYNRPGGRVELAVTQEPGYAVLTVSDTGTGIAPEQQERIFERFYRGDRSHSGAVGGTGLGLSIVKHAAQNQGAQVELTSEPGQGTVVKVSFPRP